VVSVELLSCCGRPKCGARRCRAVVSVDQYGAACMPAVPGIKICRDLLEH
jgi:hypothetical protein